jgi:hypothetical protein
LDAFDPIQRRLQHLFVEEEYCTQSLILGRGGDVLVDCQMREKRGDLGLSHLIRVAFIVKEDESLYPMPVSLFGSKAIVFEANDAADLIDEFGLAQGLPRYTLVSLPRKAAKPNVDIVDCWP